ncbi:hypothetical protein MPH_14013 [Macrophomina phaseolina MS6]|uniref:Uncharacterized protein n=1 Tax=Macrophomina phaseolina (strain MS6) TaxID=1126212 RepID=K2R7Z4_MACPH|nr:hypothetical protein MPH_14013 [Macrophomina phaseolina MS6]
MLLVKRESCRKWLHAECIAQDAIKQIHREHNLPEPDLVTVSQSSTRMRKTAPNDGLVPQAASLQSPGRERCRKSRKDAKEFAEVEEEGTVKPAFSAEVKCDKDEEKSKIVLKDLKMDGEGKETKEMHCLFSKALIR